MVVKSAAKLKHLAPQTIIVADPLAFSGCLPTGRALSNLVKRGEEAVPGVRTTGRFHRRTAPATGRVRPRRFLVVRCIR